MALPIIVPAWEFEMPGWFQGAHEAPSKPSKPRRSRTVGPQCEKTSAAQAPDERTMLVARWRRLTRLPLLRATGVASLAHVSQLTGHGPNLGDAANLLATCEWLLRRRLRQDWALLPGAGRAQVLTWVSQVKRDAPVMKATASAADAAAWTLFAMYWCGVCHPAGLFNKSLHPPTGLVRWISQFHVDQQADQGREIQEKFAHHMSSARAQCDALVRTMLKRTGSVAFLRELCVQ
ncbi:hypothetical protein [Polaromonas sp. DSR2-3-2]|uniref:hypothetical protein n=1 Tax=unclassified Polaromonas TaxID=2638319 RepID=UPI003CFA4819